MIVGYGIWESPCHGSLLTRGGQARPQVRHRLFHDQALLEGPTGSLAKVCDDQQE